jgi:hypothetical protein
VKMTGSAPRFYIEVYGVFATPEHYNASIFTLKKSSTHWSLFAALCRSLPLILGGITSCFCWYSCRTHSLRSPWINGKPSGLVVGALYTIYIFVARFEYQLRW